MKLAKAVLFGLLFVVVGVGAICVVTASYILDEIHYHNQYGKDWVAEYEKYHGPLARTNARIAAGIFGLIAISVLVWWLYRELTSKNRKRVRRRRG